jgi:hypothetical protein
MDAHNAHYVPWVDLGDGGKLLGRRYDDNGNPQLAQFETAEAAADYTAEVIENNGPAAAAEVVSTGSILFTTEQADAVNYTIDAALATAGPSMSSIESLLGDLFGEEG